MSPEFILPIAAVGIAVIGMVAAGIRLLKTLVNAALIVAAFVAFYTFFPGLGQRFIDTATSLLHSFGLS